MVHIKVWEDFRLAVEALYEKSPDKTRWVTKYKASEGVLELKITDNVQCLKYKTKSSIILNRFEALNLSLMRKMQNRKLAVPADISAPSDTKHPNMPSAPPTTVTSVTTAGESAATASAAKKKKSKKKK